MSEPRHQHATRPKGPPGLWVELTLADGSKVDGVLETTDLRQVEPWRKITLRFCSETREYGRGSYVGILVLGVMGSGRWTDNYRARRAPKGE